MNPGKHLGPYEIIDAIGAGGMGEVYKARDTRLNRTVAIKVLPQNVASDPERKQRFEREAQAVAALNHPNICVVYDIGEDGGTAYIVMEYLEGETLGARLERGAFPLEQALKVAIEIGDALGKAHERNIVHRDVKPANIILTKSGAKLLDFGLAKFEAPTAVTGTSQMPTNLTMQGTILGTPQYMAPEQVEGIEPDARADIFALGVVLYEMLTGSKAFKGKSNSQASLMASILEHTPAPISTLQSSIPRALDRVVQTCLAKAPEDRWQNVYDLVLQLKWIAEGGSEVSIAPTTASPRGKNRERIAWSLLGLSVLGLLVLGVRNFRTVPVNAPPVEFSISPPEGTSFTVPSLPIAPLPQVSPDGRHVAFVAGKKGAPLRLWVRSLDTSVARELAGTDGAILPFWSPDSRQIGFFAGGELKRIDSSGGPPFVVTKAQTSGAAWNRDGTIVFVPAGGGKGLHRISVAGGEPVAVTTLPDPKGGHGLPHFLPDGAHFLYRDLAAGTINVGSLDAGKPKEILKADSEAIYAAPGFLMFIRQGTLMGQPFDAASLALGGEPFRVADNVRLINVGAAAFSVSDTGVLVYRSGVTNDPLRAEFFDRNGRQLEAINQNGNNLYPRLSPDDSRIAVQRLEKDGTSDIWIIDAMRGTNSRLTSNPTAESFPIWSPDGNRVAYASTQNGKSDLYWKLASGVGDEELLYKSDLNKFPLDFSPDGKFLLFRMDDPKTGMDMWLLPLSGEREPRPLVQTRFVENGGRFSPDGKWIVYFSNDSGSSQIYVQPFPPTGAKSQVSVDGGTSVAWARDRKELFFVAPDNRLMSVAIQPGSDFRAGIPKPLFQIPALPSNTAGLRFSVTRDGERFLLPVTAVTAEDPLTVVLNWFSGLKK